MRRREWLSLPSAAMAQTYAQATRAQKPVKITNVRVIHTNPPYADGSISSMQRLVIAKVETSEPGLYGLGCASFVFRPGAVAAFLEKYLKPFVIGKDPDHIEDLYHSMNVSGLWRGGPIENYAVSGIDMALWDIKAKRAGMPVYQLIGGRTRGAVLCYGDAGGNTGSEMADSVAMAVSRGFRHIRLNYRPNTVSATPGVQGMALGMSLGSPPVIDPDEWAREIPRIFEHVRKAAGEKIELMQHLHGQLPPIQTIQMIKRIEPFRPYFFEDPFYPEDVGYLKVLRPQTSVPIALGEKFVNRNEYAGLITDRLIDFIRIHITAIGGFTMAWKVATLGEWFNVRTAWHAPGDLSPVGHAANGHLDLASPNFGIQEGAFLAGDALREVFPGTPVVRDGYLFINEAPGFGVDLNEKAAARYPSSLSDGNFGPKRFVNGSIVSN
ncbi:MAG TPA: enolase C-terminal domain-like protein [Bryobacteraceae bacterium]|nr:enolase C-terminal domain-like protein [Bryobacteraceae bacterium]